MQLNDGPFTSLIGGSRPFIANSYVFGVNQGNVYGFWYRAWNIYGWGPFTSSVLKVKAARVPSAPDAPVITLVDATKI